MTVDTARIKARISAIPTVADVTIKRSWPDALRVTIRERHPVLAAAHAGSWLLIDRDGVAFTAVASRPKGVLPVTVASPSAGDPATQAVLAVLKALPKKVRARVTAMSAPTPAGVQLVLTNHITVVWGGPEDSARKAKALAALLRRPARVYDVSTPGFVTTS
ncbi:MAG: cell division protein FtsQ [Frankiales bacterium]|jgi:cell division protein FtsQ|nr:cell division protein FtsQ [Frankiales bacterium]